MVSAIAEGEHRIVAEDAQGNRTILFSANNQGAISGGGSVDGVPTNTTADKLQVIPYGGAVVSTGQRIILQTKLSAADGLDATDAFIQLCFTRPDGSEKILASTDLGYTTDYPAATPATHWIDLGTGYQLLEGERLRIGSRLGTPSMISIQDDA